jgi:hypothetical protein
VKQRLPVWRHSFGRPRYRLIQRVGVRRVQRRAVEILLRTIIVEPALAPLEAGDDRVTRCGVVFAGMLIGRVITAADMAALCAAAKMQPPRALGHAFETACAAWLHCRVDTVALGHDL